MVWFVCDSCGDSIKKPKVPQHLYQCNSHGLTCVDCSRTFDQSSYKAHNVCVTESQKYAEGATKPGGFASKGFFEAGGGQTKAAAPAGNPGEDEFLAKRPPWKCSVCNVSCTSLETLQGHASGKKHIRRAQAARNAANGGAAVQSGQPVAAADSPVHANGAAETTAVEARAPAAAADAGGAAAAQTNGTKQVKRHKWKKLATEVLRANGGVLKLKKLQAKVLKSAACGEGESKEALKADMLAKWKASSQFEIGEEDVRLKA